MRDSETPWVIVLAAGDGRRISAFTRSEPGVSVPKQYCSFGRDRSMLQSTLDRAMRLAPRERIVTIVAADHRVWWQPELGSLLPGNVVVQPRNRGTAAGVLLPLVHILKRDPRATVVVLPSDHHVEDEDALQRALEEALRAVAAEPSHLVLLGIEPEEADADYGWILPAGSRNEPTRAVKRFIEKPTEAVAAELLEQGAVLNSFLFAASARTLLLSIGEALPALLESFLRDLVVLPREGLEELYMKLPVRDFSRDVLERVTHRLRLLPVPPCGWTDLGTPSRLRRFLEATRVSSPVGTESA